MPDGSLVIGGVTQSQATTKYELGALVLRLGDRSQLTFRRQIPHDTNDWEPETAVQYVEDGSTLFSGRIVSAACEISGNTSEGVSYVAQGPRRELGYVNYVRGGSGRVVFNSEPGNRYDYNATLSGKTVGAIVKDILDTCASDIAARLTGFSYVQADLDALTTIPPKCCFNGVTVEEALEIVLQHTPEALWWIDESDNTFRVRLAANFDSRDVTLAVDKLTENRLDFSTAECYTACTVEGLGVLLDTDGTMSPSWDTDLESDWSELKAMEHPDTYGRVFRAFTFPNTPYQDRVNGLGAPSVMIDYSALKQETQIGPDFMVLQDSAVEWADGSLFLLRPFAAWPNADGSTYDTATVISRYTYRSAALTGRYPATGYTGTAYTSRSIERERRIYDEQFVTEQIGGTVWMAGPGFSSGAQDTNWSATAFTARCLALDPGALVGKAITIGGRSETVTANGHAFIDTGVKPSPGESFLVVMRDDSTASIDGLSPPAACARDALGGRENVRITGQITISEIDYSLQPGCKININGSANAAWDNLGAVAEEISYDLARQRMTLNLASDWNLGRKT